MNIFESKLKVPSLTSEIALAAMSAGQGAAGELGIPVSIAVVDGGGNLVAFVRMDGAILVSVQAAIDKAYTSAASDRPSHEWDDVMVDDPKFARGLPTAIPRLVTLGGGYPIHLDGHLVGGVGVSAAHYTQDMQIARACLAAIGCSP